MSAQCFTSFGMTLISADSRVRGALGFAAWALVATTSGYDLAAAALMTAAAWFESSTRAYIPAFAVYALGKHIWLGRRR